MPKIIGGSLTEHREQVRARVFDALRHQLYQRGFDAITLSGVAAEAGVGRTAIYNHFPDKEHLLVAFVELEAERYVARLREAVAAVDDPVDKLAAFARLQLEALAEFHFPAGGPLAGTLGPSTYRKVAAHGDPIAAQLEEILAAGMRTGRLPRQDLAVSTPMVTAALAARPVVDVPADDLPRAVEAAVALVLRAAGVADDEIERMPARLPAQAEPSGPPPSTGHRAHRAE